MEYSEISFPIFGDGFVVNPPSYITLFGFNLYIYGLFITLGFILAGLYIYKRRETFGLTQDNVLDLIILAVPCGIVGARLYYALFNFSDYFGPGNWLNIFRVREGGLAVYGGVIGGAIAIYIYSRIKKIPFGKLVDAAGFGLFIGQAVGRWGNFFNREAFGVATNVPWKMGLNQYSGYVYVHPTFLYESLWNIIGFILLHTFSKRIKGKYYGQYFLCYVAWYGFGRYMIEGLRTDSLFVSGTDLRISQLLAALSFSVAVILLTRHRLRGTQNVVAFAGGPAQENAELLDEDEAEDENAESGMLNAELLDEDTDENADENAVFDGNEDTETEENADTIDSQDD